MTLLPLDPSPRSRAASSNPPTIFGRLPILEGLLSGLERGPRQRQRTVRRYDVEG